MSEHRALTNYDEAWAKQAETYTEQFQAQGGTFLSTRAGVLSFGDEELRGNQACVIVLDSVFENTMYEGKFNPDEATAPLCYAFGRDKDEMAPHESMQLDAYFKPQHETCQGCKWNEWGSADTGRGKACQNRVRLALIPAGYYQPKKGSRDMDLELFADPKHFQTADVAFIKLPVTSVELWGKYVRSVAAASNRPPHGVVTRMFLEPHAKFQYQVHFETIELVSNELASIVMARHEEAVKQVIQGYRVPEERPAAPQGSLRGLRRGR